MAPSTDVRPFFARVTRTATVLFVFGTATLLTSACGDLPSKGDALELVQHEVKEEANCTLPISLLSRLKIQHSSKALCVPREGGPPTDAAMACMNALVAAGITKRMPAGYMAEWPDELAGAGFDSVSPYERRARDLIFKGCVEMTGDLRDGRFRCGQARAERVVRVTKKSENQALVRYARAIAPAPQLASIDAACGATTHPAPEATVTIEKADKRWVLVAEVEGSPASSPGSSR